MTRASLGIKRLRAHAISTSLFCPLSLKDAVARLGFVQADPIRSPARAQDLILRHRVDDYCIDDLERHYVRLELEEDYLYAYGFMPRSVWKLIHPRPLPKLQGLESRVLAALRKGGSVHPRDLDAMFGRGRVVNAWGGYSTATKAALERLHYFGLLRVVRRESGVRVYEAVPRCTDELSPAERFYGLMMVLASVLQPVQEKTLRAIAARYRRLSRGDHHKMLANLVESGQLLRQTVEGISYLWPSGTQIEKEVPLSVRFLAPFDPIVWDRSRFEHLWHWSYRFEAYTPPAKRVRGYYAMPLLWRDSIIGWANVQAAAGCSLNVELGFVDKKPGDRAFRTEVDAEIARLESFCRVKNAATT